eukprot:m.93146 g.93146  ORF g.93146 m.93146 type:complete len:420 (+) comp26609_c1_seq1:566-1825(+)
MSLVAIRQGCISDNSLTHDMMTSGRTMMNPSRTGSSRIRRYPFPTSVKTVIRSEDKSIGLKLTSKKEIHHGQTTVFGVEPRGPAEIAGIRRGHVIIEVNGKCVQGFPHDQVVDLLRNGSRAIRLCVCNSDKYMQSNHHPRKSHDEINITPESDARKGLPSRRLEYYDLDDDSGVASFKAMQSSSPVESSTPTRRSRESPNEHVNDNYNDQQNASIQLNNLLAIFKHLLNNGGLTQSGRMLYDSVGLNELLEESNLDGDHFRIKFVIPSRLLQTPNEHNEHNEHSTVSMLRAKVNAPKSKLLSHQESRSTVRINKNHSYEAHKNPNRGGPKTLTSTSKISPTSARPSKTSKIASLALPKWPIDGRRAKLPEEKKPPARDGRVQPNQWQFVDLDRTLDEHAMEDEMRIISHNNEGVWKAYL